MSALIQSPGQVRFAALPPLALAWGEEMAAAREGPRTVPLTEVSTELQDFGATDPDFLRMTDEDIERAIAEIKRALKRNTPPR